MNALATSGESQLMPVAETPQIRAARGQGHAGMDDDAIWAMEERFWTGGEAHYRSALHPDCLMGFPAPAGIMSGPAIVEGLAQAPRWSAVEMSGRHLVRPDPELVVIGYRARGLRDGAAPYEAFCTSTYRLTAAGWRLVQHQQTPIG